MSAAASSSAAHDHAGMLPEQTPLFEWDKTEKGRVTLHPIRNPKVWGFRKTIERLHWVVEDVDLSKDAEHWEQRLSDADRHFVKTIMGLFAILDNKVIDNLDRNFKRLMTCMEAQAYLAAQGDQEWVHAEAYMKQAEAVLKGDELKNVLNSVETMPAVGAIVAWAEKYSKADVPPGRLLVAWAFTEGMLFQGPFSGLQWLRDRNLLLGVAGYNTFIARDECKHSEFTCYVIREQLLPWAKPTRAVVKEVMAEVLALADALIDEAMPNPLDGMNAPLMKQFVRFQADCILRLMGHRPHFKIAANPIPSMDKLSLNEAAKANFFEVQVFEYQGAAPDSKKFEIDTSEIKY